MEAPCPNSPSQPLTRRALLGLLAVPAYASRWTEFRGERSGSLEDGGDLPLHWSDEQNVAWTIQTDGYGQSSPVISGRRVFLNTVDGPNKETLRLGAFDLQTGEELWTHTDQPAQSIEDSDMVSKAAPTPAVDSERVYSFFETGNLMALDHGGAALWSRNLIADYGEMVIRHGIGSSLRLCRSGVLALVAQGGPGYLLCLDRETGETVWKTESPEGVTWSTPTIVESGDRELALVSVGKRVDAYDTEDGSVLWTLDDLSGAFVASPVPIPGGALIASGEKGQTIAVRFADQPEQPPTVQWRADEGASYFSSPVVYRGNVYMVNKVGVAFCLDAETGEERWHHRLLSPNWASPLAVDGRIYFFGVDGDVEVYRADPSGAERLAHNRITEESRLYGIAVAEGRLLLRYGKRLSCIQS